ncbi:YciI family protein [Cellulomonas sp. URHB0016]
MKYMLLIYNRPGFVEELSDADREALFGEVGELMSELEQAGELIGGQALAAPSTARTSRGVGGRAVLTDGPFQESKEQFAGYVALDCDQARAEEIALRWPDTRFGGAIEVRAVMQDSGAEM